jgi:hypothetical protein
VKCKTSYRLGMALSFNEYLQYWQQTSWIFQLYNA